MQRRRGAKQSDFLFAVLSPNLVASGEDIPGARNLFRKFTPGCETRGINSALLWLRRQPRWVFAPLRETPSLSVSVGVHPLSKMWLLPPFRVFRVFRGNVRCFVPPSAIRLDHQPSTPQARHGASVFWIRPAMLIEETVEEFILYWQIKRGGDKRGIVDVTI